MNDKFDALAKGLAQSVTRRQTLRHLGVGIASVLLASLGLASKAEAGGPLARCCNCWIRCSRKGDSDCASRCGCLC